MSLKDYMELIDNQDSKRVFNEIISWVEETFPDLELIINGINLCL